MKNTFFLCYKDCIYIFHPYVLHVLLSAHYSLHSLICYLPHLKMRHFFAISPVICSYITESHSYGDNKQKVADGDDDEEDDSRSRIYLCICQCGPVFAHLRFFSESQNKRTEHIG